MNSFIKTLLDEGRLKITSPSADISKSYVEKSLQSLRSANALIKIKSYNDAVALTYYSMYYSALALMYRCGIKSETHSGTIIMLSNVFKINTTEIQKAKKERIDKQYYVDFKATEIDVKNGIKTAEKFNATIKNFLDKLTENDIISYRKLLPKLMK